MTEKQISLESTGPHTETEYEVLANRHDPEIRLVKLAGQVLADNLVPDATNQDSMIWSRELPLGGGRKLTLTKEEPVNPADGFGGLITVTERSVISPHAPTFVVDLDAYECLMQGAPVSDRELGLSVNKDAGLEPLDLTANQRFQQAVELERGQQEQAAGLTGDQLELSVLLDEADLTDVAAWQVSQAA